MVLTCFYMFNKADKGHFTAWLVFTVCEQFADDTGVLFKGVLCNFFSLSSSEKQPHKKVEQCYFHCNLSNVVFLYHGINTVLGVTHYKSNALHLYIYFSGIKVCCVLYIWAYSLTYMFLSHNISDLILCLPSQVFNFNKRSISSLSLSFTFNELMRYLILCFLSSYSNWKVIKKALNPSSAGPCADCV